MYTPPAEDASSDSVQSTTLDRETQNELYSLRKRNELLTKRVDDLDDKLAFAREDLDNERQARAEEQLEFERRMEDAQREREPPDPGQTSIRSRLSRIIERLRA